MEVPFLFGVIDDPDDTVFTGRDPNRPAVVQQAQRAWTNFAPNGDPSQPDLSWPKYDGSTRPTMQLMSSARRLA